MNWTLPDGSVFAGNDAAKAQLAARIESGSLPHALLLEGPVGSGRRTLARLIAAAAVCRHEGERPCGHCPACRKALGAGHPDITELGGTEEARSFHIDAVRALREEAYILPNEAPVRVFILCDVQSMTDQAQNALLKLLEEPPTHVRLILTCENRAQLLETVRSRLFSVALRGVTLSEAASVLRRRLPEHSEEELLQAATLWGGVIGQALRSLEDGSYREILELLPPLAQGLAANSELALLKATAPLEKAKEAIPAVLSGLQLILRDALFCRYDCSPLLSTSPESAKLLANSLTRAQLLALLDAVDDLYAARSRNMNYTLFLTLLCSRLRSAAGK